MLDLRQLTLSDVPSVIELERATYPEVLLEGKEEFAYKLEAFKHGAFGLFDDGVLIAYLFCHPWTLGEVFELGSGRWAVPSRPTCMYIHDLAVDRRYRGRGLATILLDEVYKLALTSGLEPCALVAVLGSFKFWERQGFKVQRELEYRPGVQACYMTKKLS